MSQFNLNSVTLGGNLTRDPELRSTPNGTSVCKIGLAVNARRKDAGGNWVDKPNYFDVTIWGAVGENAARSLSKGSRFAFVGRAEWRQWEATDGSGKRSAVSFVADSVWFDGKGGGNDQAPAAQQHQQDFAPVDDDIPFR